MRPAFSCFTCGTTRPELRLLRFEAYALVEFQPFCEACAVVGPALPPHAGHPAARKAVAQANWFRALRLSFAGAYN